MFFFNQVAAEKRPLQWARARTDARILVEGYRAAVERGRAGGSAAAPAPAGGEAISEAAAGQTRVDEMLRAIDAELEAI